MYATVLCSIIAVLFRNSSILCVSFLATKVAKWLLILILAIHTCIPSYNVRARVQHGSSRTNLLLLLFCTASINFHIFLFLMASNTTSTMYGTCSRRYCIWYEYPTLGPTAWHHSSQPTSPTRKSYRKTNALGNPFRLLCEALHALDTIRDLIGYQSGHDSLKSGSWMQTVSMIKCWLWRTDKYRGFHECASHLNYSWPPKPVLLGGNGCTVEVDRVPMLSFPSLPFSTGLLHSYPARTVYLQYQYTGTVARAACSNVSLGSV